MTVFVDQLICDSLIAALIAAAKAKMQHEQNWMSQQLGIFMGHVEVPWKKVVA